MQNESTYALICELVKRFEKDYHYSAGQRNQLGVGAYKDGYNKYVDELTDAVAALKVVRPYY
jgi:hypothetical protein